MTRGILAQPPKPVKQQLGRHMLWVPVFRLGPEFLDTIPAATYDCLSFTSFLSNRIVFLPNKEQVLCET